MKRNQDVRKYSRLKYALLHGRYAALSSLSGSAYVLISIVVAISILIAFVSAVMALVFVLFKPLAFVLSGDGVSFLVVSSFIALVSGVGSFILLRMLRYADTRPDGHFLKPLPPEANEILPDKAVLVRASMAGNTEATEELLRATLSPTEIPAEELLRASTKKNERCA